MKKFKKIAALGLVAMAIVSVANVNVLAVDKIETPEMADNTAEMCSEEVEYISITDHMLKCGRKHN